jgi:hypothetical protein
MFSDFDDGLTPELAEEIRREIELGPEEETRTLVAVRLGGDEGTIELVLYDEDGEEPDVTIALTRTEALALAAALVELAGDQP